MQCLFYLITVIATIVETHSLSWPSDLGPIFDSILQTHDGGFNAAVTRRIQSPLIPNASTLTVTQLFSQNIYSEPISTQFWSSVPTIPTPTNIPSHSASFPTTASPSSSSSSLSVSLPWTPTPTPTPWTSNFDSDRPPCEVKDITLSTTGSEINATWETGLLILSLCGMPSSYECRCQPSTQSPRKRSLTEGADGEPITYPLVVTTAERTALFSNLAYATDYQVIVTPMNQFGSGTPVSIFITTGPPPPPPPPYWAIGVSIGVVAAVVAAVLIAYCCCRREAPDRNLKMRPARWSMAAEEMTPKEIHVWAAHTAYFACDGCGNGAHEGLLCSACEAQCHTECSEILPFNCRGKRWWIAQLDWYPIDVSSRTLHLPSLTVTLGTATSQGRRQFQEDTHFADQLVDEVVFGVLDGHSGPELSSFAAEAFPAIVRRQDDLHTSPALALEKSFLEVDAEALNTHGPTCKAGTTAAVALLAERDGIVTLYVASVGDTEAALALKGADVLHPHAELVTILDNATNANEAIRVEAAGAALVDSKVDGVIAVTRALGDFDHKGPHPDVIIADPHIHVAPLQDRHLFLLIACDGLWEVMSKSEACHRVAVYLRRGLSTEQAVQHLTRDALFLQSSDNVTIQTQLVRWEPSGRQSAAKSTQQIDVKVCQI